MAALHEQSQIFVSSPQLTTPIGVAKLSFVIRFTVRCTALLPALLVMLASAVADEDHKHGDLDEQQLGTVRFPTSCAPTVQKDFERGVALLHSFAFETAETTFRHVGQDDPTCAMAHWGIAKTFSRWGIPNSNQLKQGWEEIKIARSLHAKTLRERAYVAALGALYNHPARKDVKRQQKYLKGMELLYRHYPDDHEAAAFYAFALEESDRDDDPTHASRKKAAAILEELFSLEPNHPGVAHYLIHTYDYPGFAELGLPAARRYARIAPTAPHALHMPSHIFARLGASRNASITHMGDEGHQYHAMEFLMYAYLQSGRETEAQNLIQEVRSLPKMKSMYGVDTDPQVFALLSFSASYVLELHEWRNAANLALTPGTDFGDDTITYLVRAIGAARTGDAAAARRNLAEIEAIYGQVVAKKLPFADWVDQERKEAEAWTNHLEDKDDQAVRLLREIADKQKVGVFGASGDLPAREMLADMLLDMKLPEQALREYEAELKIDPGRFDSLYGAGRTAELTKQPIKATAYYQQLLKICAGAASTRPELRYAQAFVSTVAKQN